MKSAHFRPLGIIGMLILLSACDPRPACTLDRARKISLSKIRYWPMLDEDPVSVTTDDDRFVFDYQPTNVVGVGGGATVFIDRRRCGVSQILVGQ